MLLPLPSRIFLCEMQTRRSFASSLVTVLILVATCYGARSLRPAAALADHSAKVAL